MRNESLARAIALEKHNTPGSIRKKATQHPGFSQNPAVILIRGRKQ